MIVKITRAITSKGLRKVQLHIGRIVESDNVTFPMSIIKNDRKVPSRSSARRILFAPIISQRLIVINIAFAAMCDTREFPFTARTFKPEERQIRVVRAKPTFPRTTYARLLYILSGATVKLPFTRVPYARRGSRTELFT